MINIYDNRTPGIQTNRLFWDFFVIFGRSQKFFKKVPKAQKVPKVQRGGL